MEMHQRPVVTQAQAVIMPNVGPKPTTVTCPSCHAQVVTRMQFDSTTRTHIMAGLLCLFL